MGVSLLQRRLHLDILDKIEGGVGKRMNTMQIKCFLALANTLNFTKAASQLYISQPALSRQIATLEREINTQLFFRDQKKVRLTPAGVLLARDLEDIQTSIDGLISRVQTVGMGYLGTLTIGTLEGQWLGDTFTDLCRMFMTRYPNIELNICQGSFSELRRQLSSGQIDIAVTIEFDIANQEGVLTRRLDEDRAVFAISRKLPLAQKETITFADLMDETLLVISPEDSRMGYDLLEQDMRREGLHTNNVRRAPNRSTMMLWVEAGMGVGIMNNTSAMAKNPNVRVIGEIPLGDASSCIAWRKENLNPAIELFDRMLQEMKRNGVE